MYPACRTVPVPKQRKNLQLHRDAPLFENGLPVEEGNLSQHRDRRFGGHTDELLVAETDRPIRGVWGHSGGFYVLAGELSSFQVRPRPTL